MELSELTAYAKEKYQIQEQRKWPELPGLSVLADPETGKWAALLMRQWDEESGSEIQRCDIKCGREVLAELPLPFLSLPFHMRGPRWIGVAFDDHTDPDVVFRLFERALRGDRMQGCTIVLDNAPRETVVIEPVIPAFGGMTSSVDIPEKIEAMLDLYEYGDGSFSQKCRNFYRQGKWMEDYEDDVPWSGAFRRYFPTYHDLNVRQLRGYFSWRTQVRQGKFHPIATSLAYLYVYELLNGIGVLSPDETMKKLREFEVGFLDSGIGDPKMRGNLHRWMMDHAVLHGVSSALARQYMDPALMARDDALSVLRDPKEAVDEEIFSALCVFGGKKLKSSPVITKTPDQGQRLFATLWRYAVKNSVIEGKDMFTACFGEQKTFLWHPLANAVYWEEQRHPDADVIWDACRSFHCRDGVWYEKRYDQLYFDQRRLQALLHEADRLFRRELKTNHYLRQKADEAWATPLAQAAIHALRQASRPAVTIDLSELEQIRLDAMQTRDSLLIEAELEEEEIAAADTAASETEPDTVEGLDALHTQILCVLAHGGSPAALIKENHLMLAVAADTINAALFDVFDDNVIECEGDELLVVADYQEDILQMLGGDKDE